MNRVGALQARVLRDGWLAFFVLLVVTQTAHVGEHAAQLVQIHGLGREGPAARGVVGQLDIEWVHFLWNIWILGAVAALVRHYRQNRWLQGVLVIAAWHAFEHAGLLTTYLTTGVAGTPGLLARGGALAGGLPIARPDLHFLYNLLETLPLVAGALAEARSYGVRASRVS
ncbi:MAG: hypothetical protein AB1679_13205 [Actinomycetota bacterium]|jgi:hypothetical protein